MEILLKNRYFAQKYGNYSFCPSKTLEIRAKKSRRITVDEAFEETIDRMARNEIRVDAKTKQSMKKVNSEYKNALRSQY